MECLGYDGNNRKMEEEIAIQEAATAGLKSMERLIFHLSSQHNSSFTFSPQQDCTQIADFTVSKFKKVISLLDRTGHARFRRAPVVRNSPNPLQTEVRTPVEMGKETEIVVSRNPSLTLDFTKPTTINVSSETSSFMSSITADGSVSNGKVGSTILSLPPPPPPPSVSVSISSAGKPPLPGSYRKKCNNVHEQPDHTSAKHGLSSAAGCHCSKKRYY